MTPGEPVPLGPAGLLQPSLLHSTREPSSTWACKALASKPHGLGDRVAICKVMPAVNGRWKFNRSTAARNDSVEPSHIAVTAAGAVEPFAPEELPEDVAPGTPTAAALGAVPVPRSVGCADVDAEGRTLADCEDARDADEPEPPQAFAANHTNKSTTPKATARRRQ